MIVFLLWLLCASLGLHAFFRRGELGRASLAGRLAACIVAGLVAFAGGPSGLVLQKTVALCLMPLGLLWLGAWMSLVVAIARHHFRAALIGAVLGIAVTVAGSEPLGHLLNWRLERDFVQDPFAEGPFDAVFVLGGGAATAPWDGYEVGPSGDRIVLGARLWHRQRTPVLVVSGSPIVGFKIPFDSVSATESIWRDLGVPPDAVVRLPGVSRNTREEAQAAAALARARGWKKVGLLTSAWHMRRAHALFEGAGLDPTPLAADHRGGVMWDGLYSLVPTGFGALLVGKASWEWLGAAVGR